MAATRVLGGRYRLEERLGGGGMSVVWRACDELLDRYVAVKVVSARYAADAMARDRIRTEAKAAARLNHPHITNVYDYGESESDTGEPVPYVVMELLEGPTLAQRLQTGPLPVKVALETCAQVGAALAVAHDRGLVHRDIKPANVVLTPTGAKVLDFGIAAPTGEPGEKSSGGTVWGTPAYVAPERLTDGRVVPASDVYALGLLLYRALTGTSPWPATTAAEILSAHISAEPALLPSGTGIPAAVIALCARCLAKDPEQRPTADEVARVLGAAAGAGSVPSNARGRPVAKVAMSAALAGAVALLVSFCAVADEAVQPSGPEAAPAPKQPGSSRPPGTSAALPPAVYPDETVPAADSGRSGTASGIGGGSGTEKVSTSNGAKADPATAGSGSGGSTSGDSDGSSSGGSDSGSGSGDSDSGGATPEPDPTPPVTVTVSPAPAVESGPEPVERTLSTLGGTVVARCVGSTASIVSWSPLLGFGIGEVDPGPGAEVGIVFHALIQDVKITIRCVSGVPDASIEIG